MTHFSGSPFRKFESLNPPVNSLKRHVGFVRVVAGVAAVAVDDLVERVACRSRLLFDHVPLSCVPPMTSQELDGLIATLMNCSVLLSFLSMWSSAVGTRDSSRLQAA